MSYPRHDVFTNEYGTWQIERTKDSRGYLRYKLWFWVAVVGQWFLVANQGRRRTCVELANVGYRLEEVENLP